MLAQQLLEKIKDDDAQRIQALDDTCLAAADRCETSVKFCTSVYFDEIKQWCANHCLAHYEDLGNLYVSWRFHHLSSHMARNILRRLFDAMSRRANVIAWNAQLTSEIGGERRYSTLRSSAPINDDSALQLYYRVNGFHVRTLVQGREWFLEMNQSSIDKAAELYAFIFTSGK